MALTDELNSCTPPEGYPTGLKLVPRPQSFCDTITAQSTLDVLGAATFQTTLDVLGPATFTAITGETAAFSQLTLGGALVPPPTGAGAPRVRGRSARSATTTSGAEGDLLVKNLIHAGGELRVGEGYYVSFKKSASMALSTTYILPPSYPTVSGQVLSALTDGTMAWIDGGGFVDPTTTQGDVIIRGAADVERLAIGTAGQILQVDSLGTGLEYVDPSPGFTDPTTTQGDVIIRGTTDVERLAIGTAGQILQVDSLGTGLEYVDPSPGFTDPMTTAADIIVRDQTNTTTRLGVGSPGEVLTVHSSGSRLEWAPAGGGAGSVTSVNGATGAVVLDADDIDDSATTHKFATAAQLTLADNSVQPGDNISELTNDAGYINSLNFTQVGTGAVTRTIESKLQDVVSVKDFGAVGNGVTNDAAAIQAALDAASVVYFPPGTYAIATALDHPSNVTIFGNGATIKATASMTGILEASTKSNLRVEGLKFDANQNCTSYTVNYRVGCTDVVVDSCEFVNWTNGLRVASNVSNRAERIRITNNYIHTPATSNAYYPLSVQSTTGGMLVTDVTVENNTVVGVPGHFSPSNQQTADQINLQGVQDFTCCNNSSFDGGEMGITVSRLSQRGLISGNVVKNSDSHGINLGSGYMAVKLDGTVDTAQTLTSSVGGVTISSGTNFTYEGSSLWYGLSLTGGKITAGSTISDGTNTRNVDAVWFTRDLICTNNTVYGVATDAAASEPSSGIFTQQTNDIAITNNIIRDPRAVALHQYGIDARQSDGLLILANKIKNTAVADTVFQGTTSVDDVQLYGNLVVNNTFVTPKPGTLVISGDSVTINSSYARVDTEGAAATDDLTTINGGIDGQRLTLQSASAARDVTLRDGTGNLRLAGDFTLSHTDDTIELIFNGNISSWCEISRSDNAV